MATGDRVMVRGGDGIAGTVLFPGEAVSRVLWDNGQVWSAWNYSLERVR